MERRGIRKVAEVPQSWYNFRGVVALTARLENVLRELEGLSVSEARELYRALLRKVATPLRDPKEFFDDWDDPEVDAAYAETW